MYTHSLQWLQTIWKSKVFACAIARVDPIPKRTPCLLATYYSVCFLFSISFGFVQHFPTRKKNPHPSRTCDSYWISTSFSFPLCLSSLSLSTSTVVEASFKRICSFSHDEKLRHVSCWIRSMNFFYHNRRQRRSDWKNYWNCKTWLMKILGAHSLNSVFLFIDFLPCFRCRSFVSHMMQFLFCFLVINYCTIGINFHPSLVSLFLSLSFLQEIQTIWIPEANHGNFNKLHVRHEETSEMKINK